MPYADIEARRRVQRESHRRRRERLKAARLASCPPAPSPVETLAAFLETLTVSQGPAAGEPFMLLPWEARFLRGAFAPDVDSAALTLGRGNGKSALVAGLAAAAVVGPLAQPRGEVVAVASSFAQAKIVYRFARDYLRPWTDAAPERYRVLDSQSAALIEDRETGASLRCIGSDPKREHGLGPRLILADEPAQWPVNFAEPMYAALATSRGKVEDSRLIALGTRPADAGHWFSRLLEGGPGVYAQVHAASAEAPPFAAETIEAANPSLPYFPALRTALEREAERAALDASLLPMFRSLRLNQGVADVEARLLLDVDSWARVEVETLPAARGPFVVGVDLGGASSMTGAAAYWPDTGRLEAVAWFPGLPSLAERGLADGVGRLYVDLAERGELLTTPGRTVPPADVVRWCLERWGRPAVVVGDRYKQSELEQAAADAGLTCPLVWRGQGWKDGSEDVRRFRGAVLGGRVSAPVSLLIRSQLAEATTVSDVAGNEKLSRGAQGGRRVRAKDDAIASAILAVSEGERRGRSRPRRARWALA